MIFDDYGTNARLCMRRSYVQKSPKAKVVYFHKNMAACFAKEMDNCVSCMGQTEYICIDCGIPICNKCCIEEIDDEARGWIPFRSVGYCAICTKTPPRPAASRRLPHRHLQSESA